MRQTSLEAYRLAESSGLLSKRRLEVFKDICENGPCSMNSTWRRIAPNSANGSITTRFSELERMELIVQVGLELDKHSGMKVALWDVTGKSPKKLEVNRATGFTLGVEACITEVKILAAEAKIPYAVRLEIEEAFYSLIN